MIDRAAIVAKISAIVAEFAVVPALAVDKPIIEQSDDLDSLDMGSIRMMVEDEFGVEIDEQADWSVDHFADAVIAARDTGA